MNNFIEQDLYGSLIGGTMQLHPHKEAVDFISPTTEKPWKKFQPAGPEETELAIQEAQKGYSIWSRIPSPQRARHLHTVADILRKNGSLFAEVMAYEMGKPVTEGLGEVEYSASFFDWFAGEAERVYGLNIPSQYPNKSLNLLYEPIGVCGVITPWNFPIAMAARKVAAALAAGCSAVVKPSSETPLSMLLLAQACIDAGITPSALNVVIGPEQPIGKVLLQSQVIRKITFTGSTNVGKYLYKESADTLKKLSLELGGHAPLIIFADADIEKAVQGTITAKFRNTGQTCICANRILVQKDIYDDFMHAFIEAAKTLTIGNPLDPKTEISTVLHPISQYKVHEHVNDALAKGAKPELTGSEPYEPQILSGITPSMQIFREETFGPVAPITKFSTFEEAIALANASEYGLAAYLFTKDLSTAHAATSQLEYGIIGVNDGLPSTAQASFGGVKNSGFGREGGPHGIYEYLVEKYVSIAY